MATVKEILSANRDSIISSIKFVFKVYSQQDIKQKMIEFLDWASNNENAIFEAAASKRVSTLLKDQVIKMSISQKQSAKDMSLRDIVSSINDINRDKGLTWNPITRDWA